MTNQEAFKDFIARRNNPNIISSEHKPVVKPTAKLVAIDPSMNFLLMQESGGHYRSSLQSSQFKLPDEQVDQLCAEYYALPIDMNLRVLKIQSAFGIMKSTERTLSCETGRTLKPDTEESLLELGNQGEYAAGY